MKRTKNVLSNGIHIQQVMEKFGKRSPRRITFLTADSCVDTWPPIPGGG